MSTPVEHLRVLLDQVCEARQATSTAAVVKLEDNLLTNKQRLIDLLQDKPKNPEHRKSLEAGKAFINGKEHRVNYDFIREAIYLSDHLNLDEYEASRLLYGGISQASTLNSTALDTAVYLYHSERGYVLAILNIILEAAKDETVENGIRYVFTKFMGDIVDEKPSSGTTFISKIITSTKELSKIVSSISKSGMLESGKTAAENQQKIREAKYREEQQKNPQQAQVPANQLIGPDVPVAFKPETVKLRVDRLNEERISLVQILYHIATLYWLPEDDLLAIITKLQNMNLSDNTSSYMLTALLASISFEYNKQPHHRQGTNFSTNSAYLKKLHDQITTKPWKVDVLKAVVMIQWALFIEVLSNKSPDVTQNLAFDKNARIELVKSAISLGAFGFMNNYLLYFKQNTSKKDTNKKVMDINEDDSALEIDGLKVDPNDHAKFSPDINTDFQNNVICELANTMTTFIEAMSTFYSDFESRYSGVEEIIADKEYQDIVKDTLVGPLTVLASVYRNRLDAGLEFWDNSSIVAKFFAFLLGLKLPGNIHFPATLDFIGAISTGIKSADLSHSLFSIGTHIHNLSDSSLFSWGKYFYTLQFFYNKFQAHKSEEDMPPVFPPAEEEAIIKFTYLCQQVVQYSNKARKEIWETPAFEAHASIVNLINCPISTRLRAALYDLLAAFCSSWGGGIEDVGKRCAQAVWNTLERSDMIIPDKVMVPAEPPAPVTSTTTANTLFNGYEFKTTAKAPTTTSKEQTPKLLLPEQPVGFLRVLEEEKSLHVYTQTQSVLHLLANIIHTPTKRDELIKAWGYIESSVPRLLGLDNNRTPRTSPYISLVVDHILLKLKNLPYDNADTQWQLTDTCLTIIENSIMSFNIEPLCDYIRYTSKDVKMTGKSLLHTNLQPTLATEVASALQESLLTYITQPGYDVLVAILSGGSLVNEMFKIVAQGKEAIAQFKADKNDYFRNCLTRCLRIFSKVLKIQNAFVNVFLPQLHISSQKQPMGELKLGDYLFPSPPASLRSLGNLMLFNTDVIVQMALMVDCDDYEDICALSACILSHLSSEPEDTWNDVKFHNYINVPMCGIGSRQLAGILLSSPGASSIIFGFSERLEVQTAEVTTYDDYEYDMNIIPFWLAEKTLFNVNRLDDFGDNYHHAWSIRITILDMLLMNLEKELKSPTITEFLLGFDVKELETHGIQHKSIPTDVESRSQLACLLSILEMLSRGTGEEEDDNSRTEKPLIRTHPILAEKCYQLIYKLCVRESVSTATLHYLRTNCNDFLLKQFKSIACRLESSVGVSEPYFQGTLFSADETRVQTDFFTLVSVLNQRAWLLKLIALELHRTAHTFHRTGTPPLLKLLYGISEEVPSDQEALIQHMESMGLQSNTNYQQPLWNMLEIINSLDFAWKDELDEETTEPLSYYSGFNENNYTMQKDGYTLYDIRTIYKVLRQHQLTHPDCANMSPEQLKAVEAEMGRILKRLVAENRHIEIKNGKLHCLRAWKDVVEITIWDCFDSFSFETREKTIYELLSVLLPKLENGTGVDKGLSKELGEIVLVLLSRLRRDKRRQAILQVTSGSLAAQHVLPEERLRWIFTSIIKCICKDKSTVQERRAMYSALVNLLQYASPDNSTRQKNTSFKNFQHFCEMHMEKLLDIICGDVKNSGVAYETTAYSLLRALYSLLSKEKNSKIHQYLIKSNFLQYANDMIGHSNSELSKAIEDRDASLVPLEAYEAKMSLFLEMASDMEGSSQLIDNGVLSNITTSAFINARYVYGLPRDIENTHKVDRHRRMLTPVLELADALLTSISSEDTSIVVFESWLTKQSVIVQILEDKITERRLSSLYILRLATTLLRQLGDQPFYFADLEKRGLDMIDSLMMSLIPKYCVSRNIAASVLPTCMDEERWARQIVIDDNGHQVSLLTVKAEEHITTIRNNLLAYAQASTFRRYPNAEKRSFKPTFTNTLQPIEQDSSTPFIRVSTKPSLTTLVSCLASTGKKLTLAIEDYKNLSAQRENVSSLKYEETLEIASTAIPEALGIKFEALNQNQKVQVLATEINQRIQAKLKSIDALFLTIEDASVILWRHLIFFLSRSSIVNNVAFSPATRYDNSVVLLEQALYQTSLNVIDQLKPACHTVVEPVMKKLEKIPTTIQTSSQLPEIINRIRKCYQ